MVQFGKPRFLMARMGIECQEWIVAWIAKFRFMDRPPK